jgi:hypothetical protein
MTNKRINKSGNQPINNYLVLYKSNSAPKKRRVVLFGKEYYFDASSSNASQNS